MTKSLLLSVSNTIRLTASEIHDEFKVRFPLEKYDSSKLIVTEEQDQRIYSYWFDFGDETESDKKLHKEEVREKSKIEMSKDDGGLLENKEIVSAEPEVSIQRSTMVAEEVSVSVVETPEEVDIVHEDNTSPAPNINHSKKNKKRNNH